MTPKADRGQHLHLGYPRSGPAPERDAFGVLADAVRQARGDLLRIHRLLNVALFASIVQAIAIVVLAVAEVFA